MSYDNDEMDKPSFLEHSENNSIPKLDLPGRNLNSLNELKYHDLDPDYNAQHSTGPNTSCHGVE